MLRQNRSKLSPSQEKKVEKGGGKEYLGLGGLVGAAPLVRAVQLVAATCGGLALKNSRIWAQQRVAQFNQHVVSMVKIKVMAKKGARHVACVRVTARGAE